MFLTESNSMQIAELNEKSLESRSTVESEINDHVSEKNQKSFVSFQKDDKHICGGARVKRKKVLIISRCKIKIYGNYESISPVIPALPINKRRRYFIESFIELEGTLFYLVIVSSN